MHGSGDKSVQGFDEKSRRNNTTWNTRALVEGWDQNGSFEEWLGGWIGFGWLWNGTGGVLL
jgi:hypothetical protein